jgi:hypothetical protein
MGASQSSEPRGSKRFGERIQFPSREELAGKVRLPDGSKSVQSVWVWRGFFFLSLIGLGFAISRFNVDQILYGWLWVVISLGWFGVSMYLWRQHVKWDDESYAAEKNQVNVTKTVSAKPASSAAARSGRPRKGRRRGGRI